MDTNTLRESIKVNLQAMLADIDNVRNLDVPQETNRLYFQRIQSRARDVAQECAQAVNTIEFARSAANYEAQCLG